MKDFFIIDIGGKHMLDFMLIGMSGGCAFGRVTQRVIDRFFNEPVTAASFKLFSN